MTSATTAPLEYQRIAEAFVHPLMGEPPPPRAVLPGSSEKSGWSPSSLSVAADVPLGNVSYHVRELEKAGLVELIATTPRRGALEHYYTLS